MLVHSLILFLLTWSITGLPITVFGAQEIKPAGQIIIAGKTYEFEVELCYKMDTGELSAFTLGGSAQTSDGGKNFTGAWGAPAMYRLEGASIGFQLGGSASDFLLLVMNTKGADSLLRSKVKLGADAMAAAGPKGRSGEVATDAYMNAEILTYSRSKGLFAGVSLKGSTLRQDNGANEDLYGQKISAREIVLEGKVSVPGAAQSLVSLLQKKSPKNLSE